MIRYNLKPMLKKYGITQTVIISRQEHRSEKSFRSGEFH